MRKRFLCIVAFLCMSFLLLTGCGSKQNDTSASDNTEASDSKTSDIETSDIETTTEAKEDTTEGQDIEVKENLLSVEIKVPVFFFSGDEEAPTQEDLDQQAKDTGGDVEYILNDDDTVTMKMSKAKQEEMLEAYKACIPEDFQELISEDNEDRIESFLSIDYNDDLSEFTITVDPDKYGGFDAFNALTYEMQGYLYQALSGVKEEDRHVIVKFVDGDGNVIETMDSDALFEEEE